MPAGFEKCRAQGGKVRTASGPNNPYNIKLKPGEYMHVCFLGEKMYRGEKKTKKPR